MPRKGPRTPQQRETENAQQRARYQNNPKVQKQHQDKAARWRERNPGKVLARVEARSDRIPKIYFIRAGQFIKIGFTTKMPWARMAELQVGNPEEMTMLFFLPGTIEQEKDFHRKFYQLRARGEWFRLAPELVEFIESLKTSGVTT